MGYKIVVVFNEKGRNLVGKSIKKVRLNCHFDNIKTNLYELIPECLIDRYEVVSNFDLSRIDNTLVKIVHEEESSISYFGVVLGVDYADDRYKVFIFDLSDEMSFSIRTGKSKYYRNSYILRQIEEEEDLKRATELSELTRSKWIEVIQRNLESISLKSLRNIYSLLK